MHEGNLGRGTAAFGAKKQKLFFTIFCTDATSSLHKLLLSVVKHFMLTDANWPTYTAFALTHTGRSI